MQKCMNKETCSKDWIYQSANFLDDLWKTFHEGYVFISTKDIKSGAWQDHCFKIKVSKKKLRAFFEKYSRNRYDLYFCPNVFANNRRLAKNAQPTCYAWVDIDDADPNVFQPEPVYVWSTSPARYQGIWKFDRKISPDHAEEISRELAYSTNADKTGWNVTKCLRIPWSFNHKSHYKKPLVQIVSVDVVALKRPPFPPIRIPGKPKRRNNTITRVDDQSNQRPVIEDRKCALKIWESYREHLDRFPSMIIRHRYVYFSDRSSAIYAIVSSLNNVGADRDQIRTVLWNSPYFQSKYGSDLQKLEEEITRIIHKSEEL